MMKVIDFRIVKKAQKKDEEYDFAEVDVEQLRSLCERLFNKTAKVETIYVYKKKYSSMWRYLKTGEFVDNRLDSYWDAAQAKEEMKKRVE